MDTSNIPPEILEELEEDDLELFEEAGLTVYPKDYYFKASFDLGQDPSLWVIITPKKFYDTNGYWFDGHISQEAGGLLKLAPDYYEMAEGEFEASGPYPTVVSIEADLKARGFIHNPNL